MLNIILKLWLMLIFCSVLQLPKINDLKQLTDMSPVSWGSGLGKAILS